MERLNRNEFKLFESLASLTQNSMRRALYSYLKKRYKKVIVAPEYLYAVGEIPIALVAHMDTVFSSPPEDIYYDDTAETMYIVGGNKVSDGGVTWIEYN